MYPVQHTTFQELLSHCSHSKAHSFKEEWEGGTMQRGVRKGNALVVVGGRGEGGASR